MRSFNFSNNEVSPITVWLEPWAHDFTVRPKETLQITTTQNLDLDLDISRSKNDLIIYVESKHRFDSFDITIDEKSVACGYQRELNENT